MTNKQKFNRIDQSKLEQKQVDVLQQIKQKTNNFTAKDEELNKKISSALDNIISALQQKNPEALKPARGRTAKGTTTKKAKTTPTKSKSGVMKLAKEIRKQDETWADARKRASEMIKNQKTKVSAKVDTEIKKLLAVVKKRKELQGFGKSDIQRDSVRKAKPKGKRVVTKQGTTSNQYGTFQNKLGRKYYENRDNHSDRLAPKYPKNFPLLATGGSVTNERKHVNKSEDYEVRYAMPRPNRKGYKGLRSFEVGGVMAQNQAVIDMATQPYVNYYLGEGASTGIYSRGGLFGKKAKVNRFSDEFASSDLIQELSKKYKGKDVIAFAYTDYGGDYLDKVAIEYFLENYPNNIVVENTSYFGKNAFVFGEPATKWIESTEDYPLGFEDFESYYYEQEFIQTENDFNYFLNELENDDEFVFEMDKSSILEYLMENYSGYFNMTTQGLDYNSSYLLDDLIDNGYISKNENYAKGGGVRKVGNREYALGRNWTNDHRHTNKSEEHEVKYNRKSFFMSGGKVDTPKIYVADLEAYNSGKLVGQWMDLTDYDSAEELMEAIQKFLIKSGGEEYAIHDFENFPRSLYSEYMGEKDFEELYEMIDLAKQNDLPLEVVAQVVSEYDAKALEEFYRTFDDAEDFAQELVDDLGIESFNNFESYLYISDTDRRLLSQDMADSYVSDIEDEDGGNRLIEEAGLDVEEYEEADSDRQEEMLDEARQIVYDEYYDTWYEGLKDPYYFLVEEQGLYSSDDFVKANFVQIDYKELGEDLEQDYFYVNYNGNLYVFGLR